MPAKKSRSGRSPASVVREVERCLFEKWGAFNYFEGFNGDDVCRFQQEAVDLAIIEVGIGGLLDNTDVGHPLVKRHYDVDQIIKTYSEAR